MDDGQNSDNVSTAVDAAAAIAIDFVFDDQTNVLSANITASATPTTLSIESLTTILKQHDFLSFEYEPDALEMLLLRAARAETGTVAIARRKDAEITIEISDDKMQAFMTSTPAYGGCGMDGKLLKEAIDLHDIDPGCCDRETLKAIFKENVVSKVCFAKGIPPVDGVDGQLIPLVDTMELHAPVIDEHGNADFKDTHEFLIVESGTPLLRRKLAIPSRDGRNVIGEELIARTGEDVEIGKDHPGAVLDPNNPNILIAEIRGHPVFTQDAVRVDNVLKLEAVDLKSGNVDFDGSVHVVGEVSPGYEVSATGDITVGGIVDNAVIKAVHNIVVAGGVIGSEPEEHTTDTNADSPATYSTQVIAGDSIEVQFMSLAYASAGKTISGKEYIMQSKLEAGEQILIGQHGGKGILVGGEAFAVQNVAANIIGSEANVKTLISVGNAPTLEQEHKALAANRDSAVEEVLHLTAEMADLKKTAKDRSESIRDQMDNISKTVDTLRQSINERTAELEKLSLKIEASKAACVTGAKQFYPNVILSINGAEFKFTDTVAGDTFENRGKKVRVRES